MGGLLAGLLLAGEAAGLAAQFDRNLPVFVAIAMLQGGVWAAAAVMLRRREWRPSLALIFVAAALMRVMALAAPVFLSDDINRYIWDGRVEAAGINPYRYIPTDPALASLQDETIFPNINRNNYAPTIYPPVAQMLFLLMHYIGENVLAVKLVLVAIEASGIWLLMLLLQTAGAPRERILLYAWHPLPVWEIAGSGHIDAAVVALVAAALAAATAGRRAWSGAALGAATLVKFFPLVLAPAIWRPTKSNRGDWRWLAVLIGVIAAAYLPYIGVGWRVLGFLPGYVAEERFGTGGGFWLLDFARQLLPVSVTVYLTFVAAIMGGLAIGALCRAPRPASSFRWATILATTALVFASPHYPWYFIWLVALLTLTSWWPAWWLTLVAVLLYCGAKTGHVPLWVELILYGGFAIFVGIDILWRDFCLSRSGVRNGIDRAI
ncbi:MAG TPA: glycosyltransferase 87 family protein [Stellaceae bacterium]|nr:glycosyltransferase 87 family protein [Stellaceae bacterium]